MTIWNFLRSIVAALLGIVLVIGLFYLTGVSFATITDLIERLDWSAFIGITVCSFLYVVLGGLKWYLIAGIPEPRRFFYMHYTAQAMLLGQFLPVPVAIAVNRAAVMKMKQNSSLKKGLLSAVYDMGFDFLIAAILIPASLLQLYYKFDFATWQIINVATIIVVSVIAMYIPKFLPDRWLSKPWLVEEHQFGLLSPPMIGLMMLLSTVRLIVIIARLILGVIAIGSAIPLVALAYATPPTMMSALLALTPANLGIAEWSWTYALTLWGVSAAAGALFSVSFRILLFGAQLIVTGVCWGLYEACKMGGPTTKRASSPQAGRT